MSVYIVDVYGAESQSLQCAVYAMSRRQLSAERVTDLAGSLVKAKFHYTDPTRTRTDPTEFRRKKVRAGPCRVRVVEFSYNELQTGYITRPTTEHGTPVSRYEQLMAAGGPSVTCHPADAGDELYLGCGCSSPSCTVVRCYLPSGRCRRRAMSAVWMQQSVVYCGAVLPAVRRRQATSNVWCVDGAVCHVLWCGVTCRPADVGDEQYLRCGWNSPSCSVVLCAADVDTVSLHASH